MDEEQLRRILHEVRQYLTVDVWRVVAEAKAARWRARLSARYPRKTILFYPLRPSPQSAIYKICHLAGYDLCFDRGGDWDAALHWNTATVCKAADFSMAAGRPVLNAACLNVGKELLSQLFSTVFGYDILVDPLRYSGRAVRKSNENATHDGVVIDCPIGEVNAGVVYQRLVANDVDEKLVEDLRAPVIGNRIPFVYRKLRPRVDRFSNWNVDVQCHETESFFSASELERILELTRRIGLEYGELDILRDRADHRVYVIDANPTPWGPPNHIRPKDREFALEAMTDAFVRAIALGTCSEIRC